MNSPGKNTGVGSHPSPQGIFPTQGSNPGLLHCRQIPYHLSLQGSPIERKTRSRMLRFWAPTIDIWWARRTGGRIWVWTSGVPLGTCCFWDTYYRQTSRQLDAEVQETKFRLEREIWKLRFQKLSGPRTFWWPPSFLRVSQVAANGKEPSCQ